MVAIVIRDSLVEAACSGDLDARNEVAKWLQERLRSFFSANKSFGRGDIDDLIHDTLEDLWLKLPEHCPLDACALLDLALSFAGTEARASKGEVRRERARRADFGAQHQPKRTTSPGERVWRVTRDRLVRRYMWRLPNIYRDALRHELAGGDHRTLAKREGISVGAARARRSRARKMLRDLIAQGRSLRPTSHRM